MRKQPINYHGMYAGKLSRGPSKFVASTRRGPATQLDNLESKDIESDNNLVMSSPRPVFNGRHAALQRVHHGQQDTSVINPQHEEIVKFVNDTWNKVYHDYERNTKEGGPSVYKDKKQTQLANFKAFDLAEYWGRRTMQKLKIPASN